MGASKLHIHTKRHIDLAAIAKVLAHPARVAILDYISKYEGCICEEISQEIGLSQPTTSQHLQVIKKAGLLKGTYQGRRFCYCLDTTQFLEFQKAIDHYFTKTSANCC